MNYVEFQAEHLQWLQTMFPQQKLEHPAMLITEEVGELARCLLKHDQGALFGAEQRYADVDWHAAMFDAIGDVAISVCSLCNTCSISFSGIVKEATAEQPPLPEQPLLRALGSLTAAAGSLCMAASADPSPIVLEHNCIVVMLRLQALCVLKQIALSDAVSYAWAVVKERKRL